MAWRVLLIAGLAALVGVVPASAQQYDQAPLNQWGQPMDSASPNFSNPSTVPQAPYQPQAAVRPAQWPSQQQYGQQQQSSQQQPNQQQPSQPAYSPAPNGQPYSANPYPPAQYPPAQYPPGQYPPTSYPPGQSPPFVAPPAQGPAGLATRPTPPLPKPKEEVRIMARVGTEMILASEVRAMAVRQMLRKLNEVDPSQHREAVDVLWPRFLAQAVESKVMYLHVKRKLPPEGFDQVRKRIAGSFDEDPSGLKQLTADAKVQSKQELEKRLIALGTTLAWQERLWVEWMMGQMWMMQEEVKSDDPVTHEEMLAFYQQHLVDYDHPARAKWEQLTVRFSRHQDKQEAYALIARMGNLVLRGAAFGEVAKAGSEGVTAADGGGRDWTRQGSLVSKKLDEALFGLPVGKLSPILEDEQGYHIVRVVQREDAYRTPFTEAQKEIAEKIRKQRGMKRGQEYVVRLKREIPVWTSPEATAMRDPDEDSFQR